MSTFSVANYNGKQPNNSAYIKTFVGGTPSTLWKPFLYEDVGTLTPSSSKYQSVLINQNLYVEGNIYNSSDIRLKDNIEKINEITSNKLLELHPAQFTYKKDENKKIHYGFIAQEVEAIIPELVSKKPDEQIDNLLSVNYLELIPLLVNSIKEMKNEINDLKSQLNKNNIRIN